LQEKSLIHSKSIISSGEEYVTLQKYFSHPSSDIHFFNPIHKTKTGTANRWGTTNSKPQGPIIMMGQSEILSSSHIIFITLFSASTQHCCAFNQPLQVCIEFYIFFKAFCIRNLHGRNEAWLLLQC
jgi:hypothetical protein